MSVSLSLLSFCLSVCLFVSYFLFLCLSLSLSRSLHVSWSLSVGLSLSPCLSVSIFLFLCLTHCLYGCLSHFFCLSASMSLYLSLYFSLCLSVFNRVCLECQSWAVLQVSRSWPRSLWKTQSCWWTKFVLVLQVQRLWNLLTSCQMGCVKWPIWWVQCLNMYRNCANMTVILQSFYR